MCSSTKDSCLCITAGEHEDNHVCECGGEWDQDGNPMVIPFRYVGPPEGLAAAILYSEAFGLRLEY